jgi:ribosomal protein S16
LVRIRLKRTGCKNHDQWRVVVTDAKSPRDGRFIEEIGFNIQFIAMTIKKYKNINNVLSRSSG